MLWGNDWHNGVVGIVASRLSDRYGAPCVLISMTGDNGKGSGRSIQGFNLYNALEKNARFLEKYGGHELAVGLSIKRDQLEAFREAMEALAEQECAGEAIVPSIGVDCLVKPEESTHSEIAGLSVLEPAGMGETPSPALPWRRFSSKN